MRRRDQRGIALPSPIAMVSLGAVVLAGVAFVTTAGDSDQPADTARAVTASSSPTPSKTAEQPVIKKQADAKPEAEKKKVEKEPVRRSDVYVEVYNNSGITGLAGATANTIAGAGWQVVGSDNWYGTIPASTVYYPDRLRQQAQQLAKDLGISRIMPAISPMRFDRLTVILTTDYS
ncbi:MAG TPA: LytR C-terminal domain-containing protein [Nocardioidaceae bacterium]|nr:LytR C-terminal domain-containing protein [Nocardioidaceae bacterium]